MPAARTPRARAATPAAAPAPAPARRQRAAPAPAGRPWAGLPPEARTAQRREAFIAAGIELFGTQGWHATTVRQLTARAGLTNRYFYESFDTTEDLLVACYETLMAAYRTRLDAVLAATPGGIEDRTRAGLACFYEAMRDPRFARITHHEVLGVSPRVDALHVAALQDFAALMMDHLGRAGVPLAGRDRREVELVGLGLAGSVIQIGAAWVRERCRTPVATVVAAALAVIVGTAQRLGSPPAPACRGKS
jgi:AcrR family transcriptional regulator